MELLVAVLITSVLLVGLSLVVRQVSAGASVSPWQRFSARYDRAMGVMRADVRGLVRIAPRPAGRSEHGRSLGALVTTHRVDALGERGWRGSAQVSYWLAPKPGGGQTLWRAESEVGQDPEHVSPERDWTPLIGGMATLTLGCRLDGKWQVWPEAQAEGEASISRRCRGVRVKAQRFGDAVDRGRALPTRTFKPLGRSAVELGANGGEAEPPLGRSIW